MRWTRIRVLLTSQRGFIILSLLLAVGVVTAVGLTATAGITASPATPTVNGPVSNHPRTLAGTILRVRKGTQVGDLRIVEMSAPDAADPPYARCLLQHTPGERVVNFDLNWAAINFGQRGTAPAVHVTILAPDDTAMIAQVPIPPAGNPVCRKVRSFYLSAESPGWQLVYGLTLTLPRHTPLRELTVWIDGHPLHLRLIKVCPSTRCFQGMSPPAFTVGTPYSVSMTI